MNETHAARGSNAAGTAPQPDLDGQLTLDGVADLHAGGVGRRAGPPPAATRRGPKGARVSDVVVAEGSCWRVVGLDQERREAICRLLAGSESVRRYRARQIVKVERAEAA
jgi:hypothetical protein